MPQVKQLDWSKHQPDQTYTRKPAYNFRRFASKPKEEGLLQYNHEKNTSTPPQKDRVGDRKRKGATRAAQQGQEK